MTNFQTLGVSVGQCDKCGSVIWKSWKRGSGYIREIERCKRCGKVFVDRIKKKR